LVSSARNHIKEVGIQLMLGKPLALGATVITLFASPVSASPTVKWLTCQFFDSAKNQVVHLKSAFPMGGTVDLDKNCAAFLVAAQHQGLSGETSKTEGVCLLSKSENEALVGVNGFVKCFKAQGAKERMIGFAPS
jgi:hypothetical protein